MGSKNVIVIGATGLVGQQLVQALCEDQKISSVTCFVRRPLEFNHSKLSLQMVNFMDLDKHQALFQNVDAILCCIGTTMKQAKSREQFQIVDHYIPKVVARIAKDYQVPSYSLVSSVGAKETSRTFYLSVKGKIENDLKSMGFNQLLIYRPSLLIGQRSPVRLTEVALSFLMTMFSLFIPKRYRPTDSGVLATLMVENIHRHLDGIHIFEPDMIT